MMKLPICLKQNNNPGNELVVSTLSTRINTQYVKINQLSSLT